MNYVLRQAQDQKKLRIKKEAGFTLIELLAAIVVIMIVGTILSAILFSSLRGTNKTNNLTLVRQNGNNAISQMTKMLRGAQSLDYPTSCILPPAPTPTPAYDHIIFTSFDGGQTTFSCSSTTVSSSSAGMGSASLLDTLTVSVVSSSCYFTCSQDSILDSPKIGINFSLTQYAPTGATFLQENQVTAIPFRTSVILRNPSR